MNPELILIISLIVLTGVPTWVTHYVFDKVSGFPLYISIVMHALLFGMCYTIIQLTVN